MRAILALAVVCVAAGFAGAAERKFAPKAGDRVTTTDGASYTRAADGHLYPSAHVRADGSVSDEPVAPGASRDAVLTPAVRPNYTVHPQAACPGGSCPTYAPQRVPVYQFPQSGCPNGKCPLPR